MLSKRGQDQLENEDYLGAIASFRIILQIDSLNVDALSGLAETFHRQKKTALAGIYRRRATYLTYTQGRNALANNKLSDAIAAFDRTHSIEPHHPLASIGLGEIALKRGRREEALEHFKNATESAPDYSRGFVHLGSALADLNRLSGAKTAYDRAIALNINALEAYIGLGEVLIALGEPLLALEQFDKALMIDPESAAAKSGRVKALEGR